jgi:prevent-host-death family protein
LKEAQATFEDLVRQVVETGEQVMIERDGVPQVVVVPAKAHPGLHERRFELRRWLEEADRVGSQIREQLGDRPLPDLDELIDGGRDERDDRIIAGLH